MLQSGSLPLLNRDDLNKLQSILKSGTYVVVWRKALGGGYIKYILVIFRLLFHLKQNQFKFQLSDYSYDVEFSFMGSLCDSMMSSQGGTHLAFD